MAAKFFINGVGQMQRAIRLVTEKFPDGVGQALYEEMKIEAKASQARTPYLTHALQLTHTVEKPVKANRTTYVSITVGGVEAPYAVYVHEDPDAVHPHGEYKFLEKTLRESRPFMGERVARRLQRELGGVLPTRFR